MFPPIVSAAQPRGFLQKDQGAPTAAQRQKEREERQRQALQRRKERLRRAEERQQMEGDAWQFYLDSCPSLVYQASFCGKTSAKEIGSVNQCDSAFFQIGLARFEATITNFSKFQVPFGWFRTKHLDSFPVPIWSSKNGRWL